MPVAAPTRDQPRGVWRRRWPPDNWSRPLRSCRSPASEARFAGIGVLLALGVMLTASNVTWLLTLIVTLLAAAQYALLRKDLPRARTPSPTARLVAQWPLLILMACQLARPLFGASVPLLTVIGAQKENAALAASALAVLAASSLALAPLYIVLGASIAVAITTLFWLLTSAVVLLRLSGLRTDTLYLLGRLGQPRRAEL